MIDEEDTVKFAINSALSCFGGQVITAKISGQLSQMIFDKIFSEHLFYAVKKCVFDKITKKEAEDATS